jgi:purine-binding chemotaxis protein CheW
MSESAAQLVLLAHQGREYALPIEDVSEVVRMVSITPVPETPGWLLGVINLRGRSIPVMDLGGRLGLPFAPTAPTTPIVVVERSGRMAGVVVEGVVDIATLPVESSDPAESILGGARADLVSSVARLDRKVFSVLDVDRLLAPLTEPIEVSGGGS